MATGIYENLNWNLLRRATYQAQIVGNGHVPIPLISFGSQSPLMMFGFRSETAKSKWWLAARVSAKLFTLPSSTSQFLAAADSGYSYPCGLGELTIVRFPVDSLPGHAAGLPFAVEVKAAPWLRDLYMEAWGYDG